jgi:pimeloyl-ACP methyl ester carboxylesterase
MGVLTEPDPPPEDSRPAVVLSNAGTIHRIGPNRVYVKLARSLARQGFRVLRFDLSGIGDSLPRPDHMPAEQFTIDDVIQAMDYLSATYGSQHFMLMGHCAGAYHSFRTAAQDQRVSGVVMINPDGGEAEWIEYDRKRKLARYYQNYYSKKTLNDPQRWKRFFTGQISYRNVIKNLLRNVLWNRISGVIFRLRQRFGKRASTQVDEKLLTVEATLRKLFELDSRLLLVYTEGATSLERVQTNMGKVLKQLIAAGKLQLTVIPGADHIFTPLASQADLLQAINQWTHNILPG